jgi:putative hydrolase of the HAD superfamily
MCRTTVVLAAAGIALKIALVGNDGQFRGVIIDWHGVLTPPLVSTVRAWVEADGIDWECYQTVMRRWISQAYEADGARNPIHALERGECPSTEFEQLLAAELVRRDGQAVIAEGLLRRMFAAGLPQPAMYATIRALRAAGLRTALLSNSWGCQEYPRSDFPGLFDAVVLSGEVGMRKPEPEIFQHAAQLLDLDPARCVFVDDMAPNVAAAQACGMTALLHTDPAATASALQGLLGVPLAPAA